MATLGSTANLFLSILVSLACFTTAVGIVTGTSDFIKGRFNDSIWAYRITAFLGCLLGVLIGQFNVGYIILVAVPSLMFIYPITIVLILLNAAPSAWSSTRVFRSVVLVTAIFSVPNFLGSLGWGEQIASFVDWIPLSEHQMGWVFPALLAFVGANLIFGNKPTVEE